jgi:hypothetical protein
LNVFEGYTPEQLALIDKLRKVAREKALIDEAADTAAESVRRINALGFWRRLYVNTVTRVWSTLAAILYPLSRTLPWLLWAARASGRRVLQPPSVWPELRNTADGHTEPMVDDPSRRAAAFRAIAEEVRTLATNEHGSLSVEQGLQVEEVVSRIEQGADERYVREVMRRIRDGESLVQTLRRR